ncbi:MAG: hypothetical protein JO033_25075, partial [Acidobacteriaceae bacterium]|nr:hypothetical protein [Acidobacteriaceae bacterium]
MQTPPLQKLLKGLQLQVRSETEDAADHIGRTQVVPENLRTPEAQMLHVGPDVSRAMRQVATALQVDLKYEHLEDKTDDAVWEFVCRSALQRGHDHVVSFLRDHAKEPRQVDMLFGIDYLTVVEPFVVQDAELLSLPDASSPEGAHLRQDPSCGSVVKLTVTGTSSKRTIERGRIHAQDVLRVLRVSLAKPELLHRWQLRFRLGELYVILDQHAGFQRHEDKAVTLDLPHPPGKLFPDFTLLRVPHTNQSGVQNQAALALKWIDQARLAIDPLHQVTFLFSALEAILGAVSIGHGDTMLRDQLFEGLDRLSPVERLAWS